MTEKKDAQTTEQPEAKKETTMGRELGWLNQSADLSKVQDVELLMATGYDAEYVKLHHRVRKILEANTFFDEKIASFGSPKEIYQRLSRGDDLRVKILDEEGQETDQEIDLRELANFLEAKKLNQFLGPYRLSERETEKNFWAGKKIAAKVPAAGGEKEVDLMAEAGYDDMEDFDLKEYFDKTREYQVGLQYLGSLRDQALKNHHGENGGQAQYFETGFLTVEGRSERLWMPVSETMAARYVNVDKRKTSKRFRAEGHVHEVTSAYDENASATVKFDYRLLRSQRQDITDYQSHQGTNQRMFKAAIGLLPDEDAFYKEEPVEITSKKKVFGKDAAGKKTEKETEEKEKLKLNVVYIGNRGRGKIIKSIHNHHDRKTEELLGRKLSSDEASDLIMTDIIGPFIANNSSDWLMCFAKATGVIKEGKAITEGDWAKQGFVIRAKCKNLDKSQPGAPKYEDQIFTSADGFFDYINKRIELGEIEGVVNKIPAFKPATKMESQDSETDLSGQGKEEGEIELTPEKQRIIMEMLLSFFGGDKAVVVAILDDYSKRGLSINIQTPETGGPVYLSDFLKAKLRTYPSVALNNLTEKTGEEAREKAFKMLEEMSQDDRTKLFQYVREK